MVKHIKLQKFTDILEKLQLCKYKMVIRVEAHLSELQSNYPDCFEKNLIIHSIVPHCSFV